MKNVCRVWPSLVALGCVLAGCVETREDGVFYDTPTVDYVERLNVNDAPHQESFLNQLAMNYRSYALYNARTSGYPDVGELFAQKAVSAFSGETPFPESLDNWRIPSESERFEIYTAYNDLMDELRNDAVAFQPQLAAEAQAKFDCWISAASTGQSATARECADRFKMTLEALRNCDRGSVSMPNQSQYKSQTSQGQGQPQAETYIQYGGRNGVVVSNGGTRRPVVEEQYYPETRRLAAVSGMSRSRDGIMIVNNVNVPSSLIQPVPVPQQKESTPIVFNQNIYGGEESVNVNDNGDTFNNSEDNSNSCGKCFALPVEEREAPVCNQCQEEARYNPDDGYVTREEFIDLMLALRSQLAEINARLDDMDNRQSATPVSVPVSVQVTTPANNTPAGQAPVIVNTTTPAPVIMSDGRRDYDTPPIVVNASASAVNPASAPININNTSSSASKTEPVVADVNSSSSSATAPVTADVTTASAASTAPVNANSISSAETAPVNADSTSASASLPGQAMPVPVPVSNKKPEKTIIKVQQIPLEPQQRIMEEIFEIRFDFDKATIKPEYENIIRQLAATTQANKNVKVSVVGHTDTAGSNAYNYALGGRRAEAVQKMLIDYGIPASQIIAVSAGEEDLKVQTPNNTPNAANRRVRVVKETPYTEKVEPAPIIVEEYTETEDCEDC